MTLLIPEKLAAARVLVPIGDLEVLLTAIEKKDPHMARAALERRPELLRLLEADGRQFSALFPSRWKTGKELIQMVKIGALAVEDVKDAIIACGPRSFLFLLREYPHHVTDDDVLRVFTTAELWAELRKSRVNPVGNHGLGKRTRMKMNAIFLLIEARPSLAEKLSVHEVMES